VADRLVEAAPRGVGEQNMAMKRLAKHLTTGTWHIRRAISASGRRELAQSVESAERGTSAEIVVVIEAALDWRAVTRGHSARHRALEVFSRERVWDTEHNNGILLYLLVADRDAELVADRGFNDKVHPEEWQEVCRMLERESKSTDLSGGLTKALEAIGSIARRIFPAATSPNELGDTIRIIPENAP
jgi:uncharacterized membrane protein